VGQINGLHDVVERAGGEGTPRALIVEDAAHHDHLRLRIEGADAGQRIHAAEPRHLDVQQDHIR